jgi:hypothetical protein
LETKHNRAYIYAKPKHDEGKKGQKYHCVAKEMRLSIFDIKSASKPASCRSCRAFNKTDFDGF